MSYLKRAVVPVVVIAVVLSAMAGIWLHARTPQAAAAISGGCGQWTLVPGVNPGTFNNQLFGVAAISANDVWAVGGEGDQAGSPSSTLVEQWNGTAWNLVASPNVSGSSANELTSVAAVSATDVWAVGDYRDNTSGDLLTLTEHWNGTSWSIVPSPNVGQDAEMLSGVSADASNDAWAVGSYDDPTAGASFTLIEHWNGTSWTIVSDPGGSLNDSTLNSVVALSPSNAWAVGEYFGGTAGGFGTLIEHWDGTSWSIVSSPNASTADNDLTSLTAVGPNDIWAVGYQDSPTSSLPMSLTEHWDGTSWTVVPGFTDGTNNLALQSDSAVPGSQQILAVGHEFVGANTVTLALRWNGTGWTRVSTSNQISTTNELYGVAAVSATNAWAVGSYVPTSATGLSVLTRLRRPGPKAGVPQERTLIEHYVAPRLGIMCP